MDLSGRTIDLLQMELVPEQNQFGHKCNVL